MFRRPILTALLLIVFTFSGYPQGKRTIYDQLLKVQDGTAYYHVPVGLCEDYPEETTTMKLIRDDMEFLKKSGVNLLRISFGWDAIEEEKGKFNWLFWDDFVKMAVDEYGITLVPYVCYMPKWNSTGAQDTMFFWNYPPKDYEEFGVFMKELVNRYKSWIKSWELWNEPDISIYWQGTPEQFARMVKIGSKAVRQADPKAIIVLGGLAVRPEFFRQLFRDYGISPYVDVVNMHNYYETWSNNPIERLPDYVNEISEIVMRYGNKQSLWMAEVGYSTWRMKPNKVSNDYNPYYDYEHTARYQAIELFKTLALALSSGKLAAICWYEVKDLPPTENVIGDNNNRNLGVAYYDHSPKPATKALSFFNTLFSEKNKPLDRAVEVRKSVGSESYVTTFQDEDGDVTVVGWLKTNLPGERRDTTGMAKDTREEKIDLTIPLSLSGEATLYTETGEPRKYTNLQRKDGALVLNGVTLKGGEIFILKIKK
ncbi:MAG: cellulase family glycosylhydrolase [Ignavibacteria bacterium]|nr:cellulase family glycosylhydrolase [Ignavibacteria bacterium]MCU7504995.1 cellulase family glycosylhydrolase [Ignavibacteria bacterium]MCU7514871.1 cellulase family glycosylhydrolase [Ignavibacteria bacterium]